MAYNLRKDVGKFFKMLLKKENESLKLKIKGGRTMRIKLATKLVLLVGTVALTCGLTSVRAHALAIVTPLNDDGEFNIGGPCNSACVSFNSGIPNLTLAYSSTVGNVEAGPFQESYTASFGPDNARFEITYDGLPDPSITNTTCPLCVLVVEGDGNATNRDHYFFNILTIQSIH